MNFNRAGGILLHPTSLPGRYGIGDLGPEAYQFVDWLISTGCKLWQILPLGPTGYGDSPYQCFSAFAGNPYLISFDALIEDGLLTKEDFSEMPTFDASRVDFGSSHSLEAWIFCKKLFPVRPPRLKFQQRVQTLPQRQRLLARRLRLVHVAERCQWWWRVEWLG